MKEQVQRICRSYAEMLSSWPGVEAVLAGEATAVETFDPYFNIDLVTFHGGDLPAGAKRAAALADPAGFEESPIHDRDAFLMEGLPVSITYYQLGQIETLLQRAEDSTWTVRDPGTTLFYRICRGDLLISRSEWLQGIRSRTEGLPAQFWDTVKSASSAALEVELRLMGAAVHRSDDLLFLSASARFINGVISFLFAHNRCFEPGGRLLLDQIGKLPDLPDGFPGRFDSFLRHEGALSTERKREVAELIARSLLPLG